MIEIDDVTYAALRTLLAGSVAVAAMVSESRTRRIPNAITLGGLLVVILVYLSVARAFDAFAALVIVAVPFFWAFSRHFLHGGGVKLAITLGACLGPWGALVLVFGAALWFAWGTWASNREHERRRRLGLPAELTPAVHSSPRLALLALAGLGLSTAIDLHAQP